MGWQTGSHWSPPCPLWLRKACSVSTFYPKSTGVAVLVTSPLAAMLPGAGNPGGVGGGGFWRFYLGRRGGCVDYFWGRLICFAEVWVGNWIRLCVNSTALGEG